ncbi:MAG: hypothetical protein IIX94_02875, partial [Clostridia bacterium]|nr:hypothetical protein [Clostridia bacterium]
MAVNRSYSNTSLEYSVTYDGMRGVDFSKSTDGVCRYRFSDMQNMYKDYEGRGDGCVESIPGFRKIISLRDGINSLFSQRTDEGEYIVVHAGESLYRVPLDAKDRVSSPEAIISLKNTKSQAFTFGQDLYILD